MHESDETTAYQLHIIHACGLKQGVKILSPELSHVVEQYWDGLCVVVLTIPTHQSRQSVCSSTRITISMTIWTNEPNNSIRSTSELKKVPNFYRMMAKENVLKRSVCSKRLKRETHWQRMCKY